jgi:2-keto-3-deoxy-L-rhamnonate aldolase RhmA
MTYDNTIADDLANGDTVFGGKVTTMSPAMIEVFADAGLDYVWLDHEHIGAPASDSTTLERVRRTTAAADIEPVVRIESGHDHEIRKVLDTGIRTFVVPRIETARDVEKPSRPRASSTTAGPATAGSRPASRTPGATDRPTTSTTRTNTCFPG